MGVRGPAKRDHTITSLNREATSADRRTSRCCRCNRSRLTDSGAARNRDKHRCRVIAEKRPGSSTAAVKARRLFAQDGTFRGIRSPSEEPEREASMVDSIALAAEERLSRLFDHVWLDPERPFISAARGHPLARGHRVLCPLTRRRASGTAPGSRSARSCNMMARSGPRRSTPRASA
jgi:hypothetical protein